MRQAADQDFVHFERLEVFLSLANKISPVVAFQRAPAPIPDQNYEGVSQEMVQADDARMPIVFSSIRCSAPYIPDMTGSTSGKSQKQAKTVNSPSQRRYLDPYFARGSSKLMRTLLDDMSSVAVAQKSSRSRSMFGR